MYQRWIQYINLYDLLDTTLLYVNSVLDFKLYNLQVMRLCLVIYAIYNTQEGESLVLPKEQVENADLYKVVLTKIMSRKRMMHKIKSRCSFNFVSKMSLTHFISLSLVFLQETVYSSVILTLALLLHENLKEMINKNNRLQFIFKL